MRRSVEIVWMDMMGEVCGSMRYIDWGLCWVWWSFISTSLLIQYDRYSIKRI